MKVTLIQQDIVWGDPEANVRHLDALLADAIQKDSDQNGTQGADLYVLPEMFSTGFATLRGANVESEPSVALEWMKRKASELGAAFAGSVALQQPGGKCVNRLYFVKPDGSVTHYDKRHLFLYGGEGLRFRGGDQRVTVEYKGVRFLLAVCYDLRFPVWLRNRSDYDCMVLVANWPDVRRFAWDTLTRARAIEDQCYVLAVNRVGNDPACAYDGGTAVIGPYGETLAQADDSREMTVSAEIDLEHLQDYRKKFPVLEGADKFTIQ